MLCIAVVVYIAQLLAGCAAINCSKHLQAGRLQHVITQSYFYVFLGKVRKQCMHILCHNIWVCFHSIWSLLSAFTIAGKRCRGRCPGVA